MAHHTLLTSRIPGNFACKEGVAATLYRFFASTLTRHFLEAWSRSFPQTIYGAMPRKSARDAALTLELAVERSLLESSQLLGFSIDLSRFFNVIPRSPMQFLLGILGVPAPIVTFWSNFLARADRLPSVAGHLGAAIPACTGVPDKKQPVSEDGILQSHYRHVYR